MTDEMVIEGLDKLQSRRADMEELVRRRILQKLELYLFGLSRGQLFAMLPAFISFDVYEAQVAVLIKHKEILVDGNGTLHKVNVSLAGRLQRWFHSLWSRT